MKLLTPTTELAKMWPWVGENPGLAKFTGVVDLLAGIGVIMPSLLKIKPGVTVFAAWGTAVLMVAATVFHISRGQGAQIGFNIFVFSLALFVAYGRQQKAVISAG